MSLLHQIALTKLPGIGVVTARVLITHFGTAENVFQAGKKDLKLISGLRKPAVDMILSRKIFSEAEAEIRFIEKYAICTSFYTDSTYPHRLRNCFDAPVMLYFKGIADLNRQRVISIVGTRNATAYGKYLCESLLEELVKHDVLVVSGLAHGIDGMAHRACIQNHITTIGVLGHGLDRIYPAQHRVLAEKMIENGGLLTEFPSQTNPDRENFPKRNRIIAGMCDATIVIEARMKGGALITADLANSYNRDVFAFPGRVDDESSSGCNHLIKTNRANLISDSRDLAYILGWKEMKPSGNRQISLHLNLEPDERLITDLLISRGTAAIDELAINSKLPQSRLAMLILGLEMRGIVVSLPGKQYKLAQNN